jgi:hypothetical protein
MSSRHTETARALIKNAMRNKGLQPCTIERFGDIVPFYALTPDQLRDILRLKLDNYLAITSQQFGPVEYDADVKDFLVRRVARMADIEGGLKAGMKMLFENLDLLFEQSFAVLAEHVQPGTVSVFVKTLDFHELQRSLDDNLLRLLRQARNQEELAVYRERKESAVTALGLRTTRLGLVMLHIMSLPVLNIEVTLQNTVPEVEAENRELRDTFNQLAQLDDTGDYYRQVQKILQSRRHLIHDGDDDSIVEEFDDQDPVLAPISVESMLIDPVTPPLDEPPPSPIICHLSQLVSSPEPGKRKLDKVEAPSSDQGRIFKKSRVETSIVDVKITQGALATHMQSLAVRFTPKTKEKKRSNLRDLSRLQVISLLDD